MQLKVGATSASFTSLLAGDISLKEARKTVQKQVDAIAKMWSEESCQLAQMQAQIFSMMKDGNKTWQDMASDPSRILATWKALPPAAQNPLYFIVVVGEDLSALSAKSLVKLLKGLGVDSISQASQVVWYLQSKHAMEQDKANAVCKKVIASPDFDTSGAPMAWLCRAMSFGAFFSTVPAEWFESKQAQISMPKAYYKHYLLQVKPVKKPVAAKQPSKNMPKVHTQTKLGKKGKDCQALVVRSQEQKKKQKQAVQSNTSLKNKQQRALSKKSKA